MLGWTSFAEEAFDGAGIDGEVRVHHLDRDLALHAALARPVYGAHAARADNSFDVITIVEGRARQELHVRDFQKSRATTGADHDLRRVERVACRADVARVGLAHRGSPSRVRTSGTLCALNGAVEKSRRFV
jgi:hypothetical protein